MRLTLILRIASPFLIVAVLATVFFASAVVLTQTAVTPKEKTDVLFSLLQKANSTSANVLNRLRTVAIAIPQLCLDNYAEAQVLVKEATSLYQEGNYMEASNRIIQALQKLRETLRIVYEATNFQQTQTEIAIERSMTLNSSISRLYEQLHYINSSTKVAQQAGLNVSTLSAKIESANSLLKVAQTNLNQGKYGAALQNIAEAKVMIENLTFSVSNLAVELKTQRLEMYIVQAEERLSAIRAEAVSTANIASLSAVNQAETSLTNAKTYLDQQLVNATVTELMNSKESENKAITALKPTVTSSNALGTLSTTSSNVVLRP